MIGVILDYYDVAYESCNITKSVEQHLGYNKIFIADKDIRVIDGNFKSNEIENSLFVNNNRSNLFSILSFSPKAIVFSDFKINKKALEQMKEKEIILCIPMNPLMNSIGLQRSKNLYFMSKLFDYASSLGLSISFVTLSKKEQNLCSYMQLVELAKLIGAKEEYARKSISGVNRSLVIE